MMSTLAGVASASVTLPVAHAGDVAVAGDAAPTVQVRLNVNGK